MRIGKLRDKIVLQQQSSVVRDSLGAETVTWSTEATVWAEIDPWQLRSRLTQRRLQGESVIGVRVRTPFNATMEKRIVYEGTNYSIIEIDETRRHMVEVLVTARAEDETP